MANQSYILMGCGPVQLALGGKRVGAWKVGLPPNLDFWPGIKNQE